jgi:exonuclease VII large subunit
MKLFVLLWICLCGWAVGTGSFAADEPTPSGTLLKQDTEKTANDTGRYLNEKKEDYEKRIQKSLNDLKFKIDRETKKAQAKADEAHQAVDQTTQQKINDLHHRERALEAQLKQVQKSTDDQLNGLKRDIDRNLNHLKKGYDDFLESLKVK